MNNSTDEFGEIPDLLIILPNILSFFLSLLLLVLLIITETFAWNIRVILISRMILDTQVYFSQSFLPFIPIPDDSYLMIFLNFYISYISYCLLIHIIPISLERALLMYDSYKERRRSSFVLTVLAFTVKISSKVCQNRCNFSTYLEFKVYLWLMIWKSLPAYCCSSLGKLLCSEFQ